MDESVSLRAFARELDVSHTAVVKAVKTGRLERSVGYRAGRPVIVDPALARREWRENRDPSKVRT